MRASVPHRMRCPRHILVAAVLLLCLAASFSTATAAPSAAGEASPAQGVRSTTQNGGVADEKKTEEEELDPRAPVEHINCRACTTMAFLFFEEAMRPATTRYGVYLRSRKNVAGGAVRERLPSEQADAAASSLSGPMTKELPHFFRDRMVAELHESVDGLCERLSNFHGVLRKHLEMEVDMLSDLDEDLHSTSHQGQIYAAKRQLFVDGEVGNVCGEVLEEVDEALSSTAFEALLPSRFPTSDKPSSSSSSSSLDEDVNQLAEESSESWSFTFCTRHALCTAEQRSSILTSGSTPLAPRYEQSQRPAPAYVSKKKRLQQEQQQKKKHKKKTAASAPAEAKTKRVKAESRGSSSTMIGGVAVAVMAVVVGLAWRLTQKPASAPPPSASSSPWPAAAKEMVPAEEKPPELPAATSSE